MIVYIQYNANSDEDFVVRWEKAMNTMCKCGHPLKHHAFTMNNMKSGETPLYVSQCVFCENDVKNGTFGCKEFAPV